MAEKYKPVYDKSYALVVGVDHYAHLDGLHTAEKGARAVADVLSSAAYHFDNVVPLIGADATERAIRRAHTDLRNRAGRDDRLVIYFAGHGLHLAGQRYGEGFLAPCDAEPGQDYTLIRMLDLTDPNYTRCKHALVVLDTCYAGTALFQEAQTWWGQIVTGRPVPSPPPDPRRALKAFLTRRAYQVIVSASPYDKATDAALHEGHTPFTGLLLQALRGDEHALDPVTGLLTASSVAEFVRSQIAASGLYRRFSGPMSGPMPGDEGGNLVWMIPPDPADTLPRPVRRLLESDDPEDRRAAVDLLEKRLQDPRSQAATREILRDLAKRDPDADVRAAAVDALTGGPAPVKPDAQAAPKRPHRREKHPLEPVWVEVPAGPFLMGSDKAKDPQALDNELPQHTVNIPYAYRIGKYPVTNAEFMQFVEAAKYDWKSDRDISWKMDHPVVMVSWHDAIAYCKWLSEQLGDAVRLPTEAEWEKAARGTDGRIYPWGDRFDKNKCNTFESGIRDTTPVGRYSKKGGDSPYGCADMAGNVWEWCQSAYKDYRYNPDDGREDISKSDTARVLRGGSWYDYVVDARCAGRFRTYPALRNDSRGFRVVVSRPHL